MKLKKTVYFKIDIILEQNWYIWKFLYCMIRLGIIWFGLVNDTEASVFSYSVFTRFVRPLIYREYLFSAPKCSKIGHWSNYITHLVQIPT